MKDNGNLWKEIPNVDLQKFLDMNECFIDRFDNQTVSCDRDNVLFNCSGLR